MRHVRFLFGLLALGATAIPPAGATSSAPATQAAGAPTPAATPSLQERLNDLEARRTKLVADCQTGIAQHDGAIAVLKAALGITASTR